MKMIIGTLTVALFGAMWTTDAQAEHRYHSTMHRLADAVEHAADDLNDEVNRHYRHRYDFGRLRSIARDIELKADHIQRIVDRHESPRHIRADLEEIDRRVHEFEDLVGRSDHHARRHGEPHHVRRHVQEELHNLTRIVHDMRDHMDEFARPIHPVRPVVVPAPRPRPVVYQPHRGISFGGKWGRVHFKF